MVIADKDQPKPQVSVPKLNTSNDKIDNLNHKIPTIPEEDESFDYSQRAQWLRAAVLGTTDGLVSVASLMMGVGSVKKEAKAMLLTGFAGLFAGACSMAIGEFVSVYSQLDIEKSQLERDQKRNKKGKENDKSNETLPNPFVAAMASASAFALGAVVPLLASIFVANHELRLGFVLASVSVALVVFGVVGAKLGNTPVFKSCVRVFVGGLMAMGITCGLTKLIGSDGLEM